MRNFLILSTAVVVIVTMCGHAATARVDVTTPVAGQCFVHGSEKISFGPGGTGRYDANSRPRSDASNHYEMSYSQQGANVTFQAHAGIQASFVFRQTTHHGETALKIEPDEDVVFVVSHC